MRTTSKTIKKIIETQLPHTEATLVFLKHLLPKRWSSLNLQAHAMVNRFVQKAQFEQANATDIAYFDALFSTVLFKTRNDPTALTVIHLIVDLLARHNALDFNQFCAALQLKTHREWQQETGTISPAAYRKLISAMLNDQQLSNLKEAKSLIFLANNHKLFTPDNAVALVTYLVSNNSILQQLISQMYEFKHSNTWDLIVLNHSLMTSNTLITLNTIFSTLKQIHSYSHEILENMFAAIKNVLDIATGTALETLQAAILSHLQILQTFCNSRVFFTNYDESKAELLREEVHEDSVKKLLSTGLTLSQLGSLPYDQLDELLNNIEDDNMMTIKYFLKAHPMLSPFKLFEKYINEETLRFITRIVTRLSSLRELSLDNLDKIFNKYLRVKNDSNNDEQSFYNSQLRACELDINDFSFFEFDAETTAFLIDRHEKTHMIRFTNISLTQLVTQKTQLVFFLEAINPNDILTLRLISYLCFGFNIPVTFFLNNEAFGLLERISQEIVPKEIIKEDNKITRLEPYVEIALRDTYSVDHTSNTFGQLFLARLINRLSNPSTSTNLVSFFAEAKAEVSTPVGTIKPTNTLTG